MNLFEYQGKKFFLDAGIPIPKGFLVESPDNILPITKPVVVKPQVQIGGRGKAGAIQICENSKEVKTAITKFLNTPIKGYLAKKILIEEKIEIQKEYYFSISINRKSKMPMIMFTDQGGMDIESVSIENMMKADVNPFIGLQDYTVNRILKKFQLQHIEKIKDIIQKAYQLFCEKKMYLLEINPLVVTKNGDIFAVDAKVTLDDWEIDSSIDLKQQDSGDLTPFEKKFLEYQVTAVEMDGDIVVYGGGAGAAMATADSIAARGGSVRAIIDLGTLPVDSTDESTIAKTIEAMKTILMLKPKVIFINFYFQAGRIDYCAQTIKRAFEQVSKIIPIIVRFQGRGAEDGLRILKASPMFVTASYNEGCAIALKKAKEA